MAKNTFNESFTQGMGNEMGRNLGKIIMIIIGLFLLAALGLWQLDPNEENENTNTQQDNSGYYQGRNLGKRK